MCGRFSLGLPRAQIQQLPGHNLPVGEWIGEDDFHPRHNIAPHSQAPVVRRRNAAAGPSDSSDTASESELVLHTMKWGLVPNWSKYEDKTLNTTNARSENLVEGGGMWGSIKGRKRCAIPCEGYFEWLKKGRERFPHFTKHKNGSLMLMAGLYDVVTLEGQKEPLWTFTIVTTSANQEFSWLHDRQPVILSTDEAVTTWLNTSSQTWTPELSKLVTPYSDTKSPLECYQVPKEVGKVGTESDSFIQPITQRKDGIQAMFAKQRKASSNSTTPAKRKVAQDDSDDDIQIVDPPPSNPKTKVQKLNAWEDDSDIEYVDSPSKAGDDSSASQRGKASENAKVYIVSMDNARTRMNGPLPIGHAEVDEEALTSEVDE
ncbi:hypothetical protein BXZ70DRAFT_900243 [Cristinia sonorae]|uniref:DUF159-domain-containing protein n=1 Tax=Cristinia sonorae TaxID=1940300 RepID=A0A8K0UFE5_9AGAR|nr:hypothetical protein BXZ70DRAFT_900243 [Cristinia sonorae]